MDLMRALSVPWLIAGSLTNHRTYSIGLAFPQFHVLPIVTVMKNWLLYNQPDLLAGKCSSVNSVCPVNQSPRSIHRIDPIVLSLMLSHVRSHECESTEHCWWRGSAKGQSEAPGVALSSSYLFVLPTFVISLTALTLWTSWRPQVGWRATAKLRYCLAAQRACQISLEIKKRRRLLLSCWLHLTPCSSDLTPKPVLKRASFLTRMKRLQVPSRHAMLASFNAAVRIVCKCRS